MSGRQMSQTAKYQGAKCLGREMSLPPIVWGTNCPGSQISGRQMSQRQLSGADRRAPNVRQPFETFGNLHLWSKQPLAPTSAPTLEGFKRL